MIELLIAFLLAAILFGAGYMCGWVHGREDTLDELGNKKS